jgi:hypothetical protein
MPGRYINDHQMRLYMKFRHRDGFATAAAKAGFSTATGSLTIRSYHRRRQVSGNGCGLTRWPISLTPRSSRC